MSPLPAILSSLLLTGLASAQLQCSVVAAGESCGPTLTVTYTPFGGHGNQRVELTANGLHANSLTALYWGDAPLAVQLPNSIGCMLLLNPIWGEFHTSDASGSFSWSRSWPWYAASQFYMQMGSLQVGQNGSISILSTNCKLATCF